MLPVLHLLYSSKVNTYRNTPNTYMDLKVQQTKNSVGLVIPTERPPLVGEVTANFLRIEGVAWSAHHTTVFSVF
jgi:hypothetical protein